MNKGKYVVLLDAGHYSYYNQGVIKEYWESKNNWTQHLLLKSELEKRGFTVYTTRENQEKDLALYDRGYQCKQYNADLFLSVHSNAPGADRPDIKGAVVIRSVNASGTEIKRAGELAEVIGSAMGSGVNSIQYKKSDKGDWDYYGVLRGAVAAGCTNSYILERGFHTNADDCKWLTEEKNLKVLAEKLAKCIQSWYNTEPVANEKPTMSKEDNQMLEFMLLTNMNVRETPNGNILGVLKAGTCVNGSELVTNGSTQWLKIKYEGQNAVVAVLPESKGYAKQLLKTAEAAEAESLTELKNKYEDLMADMQAIKEICSRY